MRIPFPLTGKRKWGCLDEEQLASYVDGKLSPAAREKAEAHLGQCLRCRDNVAILVRSERLRATDIPPGWIARVRHLGQAPASQPPRWAWATATACLLVAALAATFAYRPEEQPTLAVNAPSHAVAIQPAPTPQEPDQVRNLPSVSTSPVVISPANGARVPRDLEVRWQTLPSAVSYEVRLLDADGDTVWSTHTRGDHLLIPNQAALQKGGKYFVLISALMPTGKTIHAKAVSFQVEAD